MGNQNPVVLSPKFQRLCVLFIAVGTLSFPNLFIYFYRIYFLSPEKISYCVVRYNVIITEPNIVLLYSEH
jgi:hypothetical protein